MWAGGGGAGASVGGGGRGGEDAWALFDLEADPSERRDLSAERPADLGALRRRLEAHERRPEARPPLAWTTPGDPAASPDRHGGSWVPWLDAPWS